MDYAYWKAYFESNKTHFAGINWQQADSLSDRDKKLIWSSLQQFQKGESSEGRHLFSFAKTFPDPVYPECIRLFIGEEQMHARVLGRYLQKHSIPRIRGHWVDSVFRRLRALAGIENTISVLLVAEIISKVYYKALEKATDSALLQQICKQVLKDEDQHIAFQCYTLRILYGPKSLFQKFLTRALRFILMSGTIVVVWIYHKKVLKKGGYSFLKFRQAIWRVYFECEAITAAKRMYKEYPEILFP